MQIKFLKNDSKEIKRKKVKLKVEEAEHIKNKHPVYVYNTMDMIYKM